MRAITALAMAAAMTAVCALPAAASQDPYTLRGDPDLGHGALSVSVHLPHCRGPAEIYAESADGQDSTFAIAQHEHGTWTAIMRFTPADEAGTWYITSSICLNPWELPSLPAPSFYVDRR